MGGAERVKPFGEAVEHPLRILRGEGLLEAVELGFQRREARGDLVLAPVEGVEPGREAPLHLGELCFQRREAGKHRLGGRILLGVERSELLGDLGEGIRTGILQRREPVPERGLARGMGGTQRLQPLSEALERRFRVARHDLLLEMHHAVEQRLGKRVLLGMEPLEPLGDDVDRDGLGPKRGEIAAHVHLGVGKLLDLAA